MSFTARPETRGKMLSLRVTGEQNEQLETIARQLKLRGKAEVLRRALDFWLENAEVRRLLKIKK